MLSRSFCRLSASPDLSGIAPSNSCLSFSRLLLELVFGSLRKSIDCTCKPRYLSRAERDGANSDAGGFCDTSGVLTQANTNSIMASDVAARGCDTQFLSL